MVGSVSAASENDDLQVTNDTDTVSTGEDAVISVDDSGEVLGDAGTFTALNTKLQNVANGSTIQLTNDYTWTDGDSASLLMYFNYKKNVVIDGQYHTIDAKGHNIHFVFSRSSNIEIKNINFKNATIASAGNNGLTDSYNSGNMGSFQGLIIFNGCNQSTVNNCNFTNITGGGWGNCVSLCGYAGQTFHSTIKYCNFIGCRGVAGGPIYTGGHVEEIKDGSLIQYFLIDNCNFYQTYGSGRGGCMELNCRYATVSNCNMTNCSAGLMGTISLYDTASNATIINCRFINNSATNGGAICAETTKVVNLTINNCYFEGNNATTGNGGAVLFNGANGKIDGCTFINNSATKNGGAVSFGAPNGSILNSNFSYNNASQYGGAVYASAENSLVDHCGFENNVASDGNNFYATAGNSITITNCGFDEFYVSDTGTGDGLRYGSPTSFTNAIQSIESGGIIYFIGTFTNLYSKSIEKSVIIQPYNNGNVVINLQGKSARAFTISADNVVIKGITFQNSLISGNGGVLLWNGANGVVSGCTFKNNTATNGGAIYWAGTDGTVNASTFESNKATTSGGAIYWSGEQGSVARSTFKSNNAVNGGAIYVGLSGSNSEFELQDCTFTQDSGTYGIIYAHNINTLSLGGNTFTSCSATNSKIDGVYYYPDDEVPTVTSALVYVSTSGSASSNGLTTSTATTFEHAYSIVEEGGKIVFLNGEYTSTDIIARTISKNIALVGSGNTVFNGNGKSGKFFTVSASGVSIENITFKNNANGAIEWNGANGEITNCNFTSNAASAGAIKWTGSTGTISNCVFTGNTLNIANTGSLTLKSNTFNEVTASLDSKQITYSGGNVALTGTFNAKTSGIAFSGISISVTNMASVSASVSASGAITATIPAPIPNQYTITLANTDSNGNKFVYSATPTASVSVRATDIYISPSGTGSGVSASTPTTWDNVADKLTDTGTVHFTDSTAYSLSGKTISKAWTLTSSGASNVVINGGSSTIFSITSSDVTLEKLTLISTTHPITASSVVTVRNSVLQNQIELNKASSYVYGDTITITGSFGNISPSTISAYSGNTLIGTSSGSTASYTITINGNLAVGSYTLSATKKQE